MCYRTGKYTVCRRIRASLSPEISQAGAVKGLNISEPELIFMDNERKELVCL